MNPTFGVYNEGYRSGVPSGPSSSTYNFLDDEKENNARSARDRTGEFQSALRSLQGRHSNVNRGRGPATGQYRNVNTRVNRNLEQYSQFMSIARSVGKKLSETYTKLEKLALLAKHKSLFDDKSSEIQPLIVMIKTDLNELNRHIAMLQNLRKESQQSNGKHLQSHSSGVVVSLQSKLASMSNEFKQVLQIRTETLKEQRNRQDQFSQGPISTSLPPSAHRGYHSGSVLEFEESHSNAHPPSGIGPGYQAVDVGGGVRQRPNAHQQQIMIEEEAHMVEDERASTMRTIESTIVELGGIFQQLAYMVKEQEEVVHRIDSNIENADINVSLAHTELIKYFRTVSSNRWLMIKVFGLLIFFFILFIIFMT